MINSSILQNDYIELYKMVRKYIWSIEAVEALAAVEVETYKSFPDVDTLRNLLDNLRMYMKDTMSEDEELNDAFNKFYEELDDVSSDNVYSNLKGFKEVQQVWK